MLLPHIQHALDCSVAVVGTMVALPHTVCYLLVPATGKAALRYGCRAFVMTGGMLNLTGLLLCAGASTIATFSVGTSLLVNGASLGTIAVLHLPVAQQVLAQEHHLKGYLISMPCFAIGEAAGGFLTGVFFSLTGDYNVVFIGLGILAVLTTLLLAVDRYAARFCT